MAVRWRSTVVTMPHDDAASLVMSELGGTVRSGQDGRGVSYGGRSVLLWVELGALA